MVNPVLDRLVGEERTLVAIACDKAALAWRRFEVCFTAFLDPGQQALLAQYAYLWDATMFSFGGYDGAERQIVAFSPEQEGGQIEYPLAAIQVSGNFSFDSVTHRDYLGSLLALGMKREMIGDILVRPAGCQLILHKNISSYVLANWKKVGRISVTVEEIPLAELQPPEPKIVLRQAAVASLRLDAIVAVAYSLSRTQAANLIRSGKLKHNHVPESRCDKTVEVGDMLSLAGQGRAQLQALGGQSRKGRWHVQVARFV